MPAMAPRKAHKKTRSGCLPCKRRKVKCGEEDCPCNNCVKRGLACTYGQAKSTNTPDPSTSNSPHYNASPRPGPSACGEAEHPHSVLNRQEELCLVHHYLTSTHLDFSRGMNAVDIWRDMPFHDGIQHAFVLDAVLALAALHKAYVEPQHSEKYTSACLHYQSQCLRAYHHQLSDINEENCHAMFAVSALVNVIAIAMSHGGPSLLPIPSIETLLTTFKLLRGIQIVLHTTHEIVRSAHYKSAFAMPKVPEGTPVSLEVGQAMEKLRRRAAEAGEFNTKDRLDIYNTSIEKLEDHFKQVELCDRLDMIIAYPIAIDEKAIEMLRDRDPMMMLIFVHYGVLYLRLHERWWARGFGCRLVWDLSEALHALGASWRPLTSWARSKAESVRNSSHAD